MERHVVRLILLCIAAVSSIAVESKYDDRSHTYLSGHPSDAEKLQHTHVFKESMPLLSSRTDLIKKERPHDDYIHEVMFAVQMRNMDELTRILHDVSDPDSPNYGQHMKREEMYDLISNPEACTEVTSYLHASGATSVSESLGCQYITAEAPIGVWEKLFATDFFVFQQTHLNGETHEVVRAEHYSVPREIHDHIEAVMNTIEMPMLSRLRHKSFPIAEESQEAEGSRRLIGGILKDGFITPAKLRAYYNMGDSQGSSLSTQAVYANSFYYYNPREVAYFQANISQQPLQPAISIGNHNTTNSTKNDCSEGNLDLQYIMALSPGSPTTYWYFDATLGKWLKEVVSTKKIPWVLSISYGSYEDTTSKNEFLTFTSMAIQLGVMGVTILGASGDYGAGFEKQQDGTCKYSPEFPASSPYIVSVGATMGPEEMLSETVCKKHIVTGGGFSSVIPQPAFQKAAVASYFQNLKTPGTKQPPLGYLPTGRGYPDVSMAGEFYYIFIRSKEFSDRQAVAGTSASCPVVASFISNVNAKRFAVGKGPVGWVNPFLYTYASQFVNDVTVGDNIFCTVGYYATPGWDPASGLGSINYGKFETLMLSLGVVSTLTDVPTSLPTPPPSRQPTSYPTSYTSVPTTRTRRPSLTRRPSAIPVKAPSPSPISKPTGPVAVGVPAGVPTPSSSSSSSSPTPMAPTVPTSSSLPTFPTLIFSPTSAPIGSTPSTPSMQFPSVRAVPSSSSGETTAPTSPFESLIRSALDVTTASFETALLGSVSDSVGVPTTAVTGVVSPTNRMRKARRLLLDASCVCVASVISGMTSDTVLFKLNDAISSGAFLEYLRTRSGLNITRISSASITDATPQLSYTIRPTSSPNSKSETSISIIGIIAGVCGGFICLVALLCCVCYRYKVKEEKRVFMRTTDYPEAYDGDMIPPPGLVFTETATR